MRFILIDFQNIFTGAFGTLGLAALLQKKGHEAYVIGSHDILGLLGDTDKFKGVILKESPDAVGLSVMTPYADYIDPVGKIVRGLIGRVPIIIGGYHATVFGKKIFAQNSAVDYVVVGDGEESLPLLLDAIGRNEKPGIKGVLSRDDRGAGAYRDHSVYDGPIDELPFPDESLIHPDYYNKRLISGHGSLPKPSRYVLYSRGCPYRCSFCSIEQDGGFRSRLRYYSSKRVVEHLGTLVDTYKLRGVAFLDDNFLLNKEWAYEVCEGILKNRINIKWLAQVRANLFNADLVRLMKKAGCITLVITIESGNDRIRNEVLKKGTTREEIRRAYVFAKELGILTQGTLMMGSPTETYDECLDSVSFFEDVNPDYAGVVLTTLLPGTPLHRIYQDRIRITRFRDYDIGLQEENYAAEGVRLAFHNMEPKALLDIFHRLRARYSYSRRVRPNLSNFTSKRHFLWMAKNCAGRLKAKLSIF